VTLSAARACALVQRAWHERIWTRSSEAQTSLHAYVCLAPCFWKRYRSIPSNTHVESSTGCRCTAWPRLGNPHCCLKTTN
jgi:hypothetical protein